MGPHSPSAGLVGVGALEFTAQSLVKKKAFSGQAPAKRQGGRGGEEAQLIKAKDGWPEGLLGRQSGVSSIPRLSQHRSRPCKDPSCWVTPEFISQFIKEAAFSPSWPFLLGRSGRFMGKQGLRLSCLHWRGGWEEAGGGKCTRTPTPGRVVLTGLGRAAGGRRGCWGGRPGAPEPAAGTEGLIISPSLESSAPPRRPPWEAEATSQANNSGPSSSRAELQHARSYGALPAHGGHAPSLFYARSKMSLESIMQLNTEGLGFQPESV